MARAYRFRNLVALNSEGETLYMMPREARRLAKSLRHAATSVEIEPFANTTAIYPQVAAFTSAAEAADVAEAVAAGLIKVQETSPGHWRASYRQNKAGKWTHVKSMPGPIDYKSPTMAYRAALFMLRRGS